MRHGAYDARMSEVSASFLRGKQPGALRGKQPGARVETLTLLRAIELIAPATRPYQLP
jgi:hypothetical protein